MTVFSFGIFTMLTDFPYNLYQLISLQSLYKMCHFLLGSEVVEHFLSRYKCSALVNNAKQ